MDDIMEILTGNKNISTSKMILMKKLKGAKNITAIWSLV